MKIRYVTLLAAIAGLMAACGNDRKVAYWIIISL